MQAKDVLSNKAAIIAATADVTRWPAASRGSANGGAMHKLCVGNGTSFWKRLNLVVDLCQPVSDAIHQLEADRPMASQVLLVWHALEAHARRWHTTCLDAGFKEDKVSLGGGQGRGQGVGRAAEMQATALAPLYQQPQ
jgi:hypothetical protein